MAYALTPSLAPALALAIAPAPAAAKSADKYLAKDSQRIFKTVLEATASPPTLQPDGPCERPFKAQAMDLYHGKTYMECSTFANSVKTILLPPVS